MTEILMILICVTSACFRCVEQGGDGSYGYPACPIHICCRSSPIHHNFRHDRSGRPNIVHILRKAVSGIVATLYAADTQVVRSLFVFDIEREFGF